MQKCLTKRRTKASCLNLSLWTPEQREQYLGEDDALRQAEVQAGLVGIQTILHGDDLSKDDSSDSDFVIPDVTPFRRTHDDEVGGSGSAAPQATQTPPAPLAQSPVPDLASQLAVLTDLASQLAVIKTMENKTQQMHQAYLVESQKAEDRFWVMLEHQKRLLETIEQQQRRLDYYFQYMFHGVPVPPPLPAQTVPLAQLQSPVVPPLIFPVATPRVVPQIPQPAASVPYSLAQLDISMSFRSRTSALLGQDATTSTPAASVSVPASAGGLA